MKIKQYQQGGGLPFTTYTPLAPWVTNKSGVAQGQSQATPVPASESSSSGSSGALDDAILKKAIDLASSSGTMNEINYFMQVLQQYQAHPDNVLLANRVIKAAAQVKRSSDNFNYAIQQMDKSDSWSEIARSGANIYCINKKTQKLELVSPNKFDRQKYLPIKFNQLKYMRENDNSLAFNQQITNDLIEGIGMDKINQFVTGIIDKLGVETIKHSGVIDKDSLRKTIEQNSAAGNKPTEEQLAQLTEMVSAYQQMGIDGVYKVATEYTSNRNHPNASFDYLWKMLPENMKDALIVKSVVDGNTTPQKLLEEKLLISTKETRDMQVSFDASATKATGKDVEGKKVNLTPLEKIANGDVNVIDFPIRSRTNPDYLINLKGSLIGFLPDLNNNAIPKGTLNQTLQPDKFGAFVDKSKIYFGGQKVTRSDLDYIMFSGEQALNVKLPVKSNGEVDWERLELLGKAKEEVSKLNNKTKEFIQAIYDKYQLPVVVDDNLEIHTLFTTADFITVTGESTEHIMGTSDPWIAKVSKEDNDALQREDFAIWDNLGLDGASGLFGIGDDIVKAPIFMKLLPSAQMDASYAAGHGSTVTNPTLEKDMITDKMRQTREQKPFGNANLNISALN